MRNGHFLVYVPFMILIGICILLIPEKKEETAVFAGYQLDRKELSHYNGAIIEETTDVMPYVYEDKQDLHNGKKLKDNGCPYAIKVNKRKNVVTIYQQDEDGWYTVPVKAMVCSAGLGKNTPDGVYRLGDRSKWLSLQDDVYGQYATTITGNILFHSVPYFTRNKNDLEVEEYNKLGEKASAGCIRLQVVDAKWIYDNCEQETLVDLYESDYAGPLGKPVAALIEADKEDNNWDPTDPDNDNPYATGKPRIFGAHERTVERGEDFDIMSGISAIDDEGNDITKSVKVETNLKQEECGVYQVVYSVKDKKKVITTEVTQIEIVDHVPPYLEYNGTEIIKIAANDVSTSKQLQQLLLKNVRAFDGNEELNSNSIVVDYSDILAKKYGMCQVKYQVKDAAGNLSNILKLEVDVDVEAPVIRMRDEQQGEVPISKLMDDAYLTSLVEAEDNGGYVELTLSRPLKYVPDEPYEVIYCAKDSFGNVSTINVTYQINQ